MERSFVQGKLTEHSNNLDENPKNVLIITIAIMDVALERWKNMSKS